CRCSSGAARRSTGCPTRGSDRETISVRSGTSSSCCRRAPMAGSRSTSTLGATGPDRGTDPAPHEHLVPLKAMPTGRGVAPPDAPAAIDTRAAVAWLTHGARSAPEAPQVLLELCEALVAA